MVKGEPGIVVGKKATSGTPVQKDPGAVESVVGVRKLAIVVEERATFGENALRVLSMVRPLAGAKDTPLKDILKKVWIIPTPFIGSSTALTTKTRQGLGAI